MAASVTDIFPLSALKAQLRIPPNIVDPELDKYLQDILEQAVDKVIRDSGLALIDTPHTVFASVPADDSRPLVIRERNFYFDPADTGHEMDYWTTGKDLSEPPDASISRGDVGRRIRSDDGSTYFIYTDMSWPKDIAEGTRIRIKGALENEVPVGIKNAIIVLVRSLHKGDDKVVKNYKWMLNPHRRLVPTY